MECLIKTDISIPTEYNISECLVRVGKSTTGAFIEVQPELDVGEVITWYLYRICG